MAILGLIKKVKELMKEKARAKIKKKARKKLKKLIRKIVCTAVVCFGLVMLYKHRRPIMAAIIYKKQPIRKCPILHKH